MSRSQRKYDSEYKIQAVKLAQEMGSCKRAAKELGISPDTLYGWIKAAKEGRLNIGFGAHTPEGALTLNEELIMLRKKVREQEKEINRIKKENAFLEEASAFFAASRLKSQKTLE
ncbi:MAG: transposase [Lachnospiraceae bacterium]|nr:transposase [Lachnospiraceae bacterium]